MPVFLRQNNSISSSDQFDDSLDPGTVVFEQPDQTLEVDLNKIRSSIRNIAGTSKWFETPPATLSQMASRSIITDTFTPMIGQVSFVLTKAPSNVVSVQVNGVAYGTDYYSINGLGFTWLNHDFSLDALDVLAVEYE